MWETRFFPHLGLEIPSSYSGARSLCRATLALPQFGLRRLLQEPSCDLKRLSAVAHADRRVAAPPELLLPSISLHSSSSASEFGSTASGVPTREKTPRAWVPWAGVREKLGGI